MKSVYATVAQYEHVQQQVLASRGTSQLLDVSNLIDVSNLRRTGVDIMLQDWCDIAVKIFCF